MPVYEIQAPNGKKYRIEGPAGATDAQVRQQVLQQHPDASQRVKPQPAAKPEEHSVVRDFGTNLINGMATLPDLASRAGNALTNGVSAVGHFMATGGGASSGTVGNPSGSDRFADRAFRQTEAPTIRGVNNRLNPGAYERSNVGFLTEMLGGALFPFGPKAPAARIAAPRSAAGRVAELATEQSPRQVRVAAGRAAERQGITMMPADVGGTGVRMASGIVRRTLGEIPMAEGARKAVKSASDAVGRNASKIGLVGDEAGAGQAAQRGAKAFIADSEKRATQLYDAIPIAGPREASLGNTKAALADLTAGLESNPELSKLVSDPRLQAYQKAIAGFTEDVPTGLLDATGKAMVKTEQRGGKLSWQDLKAFRTYIGEKLGAPSLQSDTSQGALKKVYASLSQDMEATASAVGPRALTQFKRANQYYKGRADRIENVLSGILGPNMNKGDEAAFQQINNWAAQNTGNSNKLARAIRSMPEDEAGTVRASIVARMGRSSPGRQNADGLEFSPAEFATQWNKMSGRAKSILFPSVKHRTDLNELAMAMDGMKRAGQYANTSNTSLGTNAVGHVTGMFVNPILTAVIAGGEFGAGALLSSPRVTRYLIRGMPADASPGAVRATISGLGELAKHEPGRVASAITVLQRQIATTFANDNVGVAAAAGDGPEQQREQQPALQP